MPWRAGSNSSRSRNGAPQPAAAALAVQRSAPEARAEAAAQDNRLTNHRRVSASLASSSGAGEETRLDQTADDMTSGYVELLYQRCRCGRGSQADIARRRHLPAMLSGKADDNEPF